MLTVQDRLDIIRSSLREFQKVAEPVLKVPMVYFDRPLHRLQESIARCEDSLGDNWRDFNQTAISDELTTSFAHVAHNLPPRALKEAIEWLHFTTQDLLLLREHG